MPHVPGKWFPHANDPDHRELYCASMLSLLKPWHNIIHIKNNTDSFASTYESFIAQAPEIVKRTVANIQYFYECYDKAKYEQEKHLPRSFADLDTGDHLDDEQDDLMQVEGEPVKMTNSL
jgi:hypothetical protein